MSGWVFIILPFLSSLHYTLSSIAFTSQGKHYIGGETT